MPIVPRVEPDVNQAAMPNAQYSGELAQRGDPYVASNQAEVAQGIQRDATGLAQTVQQNALKKANTVATLETQSKLDQWESANLFDPEHGALAQKGDKSFGLPESLSKSYSDTVKEISDGLANDDQRLAFQQIAQSRQQSWMHTVQSHVAGQLEQYGKEKATAAVDTANNRAGLYYNVPQIRDQALKQATDTYEAYAIQQGLPAESIANGKADIISKGNLTVLTRMADNDPKSAIDYYNANQGKFNATDQLAAQNMMTPTIRKYKATDVANQVMASTSPASDQAGVTNFVMNGLEGGDKVVTDSGGLTKYGVSSNAHPGTDVANLTQDQAQQIYKGQYWDKMDLDNVPPQMRAPMMAFGVNAGVFHSLELYEKSGNDPNKLIELQRQYYQKLATDNPAKYAQYLPGWNARLAKVSSQVAANQGAIPDELSLYHDIDARTNDVQVATDAKEMVSKNLTAAREAQTQRFKAASAQAYSYVEQGQEVPPSVQASMDPKDVADMQNRQGGDPALAENLRQQITAGQPVDLTDYRWRLGGKYAELAQLQGDPSKTAQAQTIDTAVKQATPLLIGKENPKQGSDFAAIDQFRRAIGVQLDHLAAVNKRPATPDEITKVTDRMLLQVHANKTWYGTQALYTLNPGDAYSVKGIPQNGQHTANGADVSYNDLVDSLVDATQRRALRPTPENLLDTYNILKKAGKISWKDS